MHNFAKQTGKKMPLQTNSLKTAIPKTLRATALSAMMSLPFITGVGLTTLSTHSHALVQNDFSNLVEQVAPAVVRVNVTKEVGKNLQYNDIPEEWRRFFGIPKQQSRLQSGYGSAFFITDEYLLTNHHVIEGADNITITFNDRREVDVEVVGSDERTDVAVLKVKPNNYPKLRIGNSKSLKVGEPVLAIGSPFGFDYSASAGIVSATSRNLSQENAVPFIQTDVALNPGNSGGPLFNQHGEVIGINSRIFSGTGGYMGLSFSIPIDLAMDVYQQIRDNGMVSRAYLGVYPQDIDRNLAEVYKLGRPTGTLVTKVSPDTAADRAGLKSGDIILEYNGQTINRAADIITAIGRARVGDHFTLLVQRDGQNRTLSGKFGKAPDTTEKVTQKMSEKDNAAKLGLGIRNLTASEQSRSRAKGVLVTSIDATGLAGKARLKRGDVITRLNGRKTPNVRSFARALDSLPNRGVVEVRIMRRGVPAIFGMRVD